MRLAHYGHPNCTRSRWQSEFATPERMRAGLVSGAFDVPCTCPQPPPVKPDAVDAPGPDCSRCGRPTWVAGVGLYEYRQACLCPKTAGAQGSSVSNQDTPGANGP